MKVTFAQVADSLDAQSLYLIILPTERCNFRCTYCYERFDVGRMPPRIVNAVLAFLERRAPNLRRLEIGWFGGEPLLAKSVVLKISEHTSALVTRYPGLTYAANMTTNGYFLDRSTADTLVKLGINSYQISLDGFQEVHDSTRRKADSTGTFDRIWSNLLSIRNSDLNLRITIRVHFTPDSIIQLDPLIAALNEKFGVDERFCIYFKDVGRLGGPNDDSIKLFSDERIEESRSYLISKLANPVQAGVLEANEAYICYASKPNSLVIRPNGQLGKCTVALYDERNNLGTINSDGSLSIHQEKLRSWMRGFIGPSEPELSCPFSAMNREVSVPPLRKDPFSSSSSSGHRSHETADCGLGCGSCVHSV
jgi:uncharacterized protein